MYNFYLKSTIFDGKRKLFSEAKCYCITTSCVTGCLLSSLLQFHGDLSRLDTLPVNYRTQVPFANKNKDVPDQGPVKDDILT